MIPAQVRTLVPARLVVAPVVASLVAEVLAWLYLWGWHPSPAWYANGPLLASVHLITVGTLAMALLGMGWQLVPVATGVRPKKGWNTAAMIINVVGIAGAFILTLGMAGPLLGVPSMIGATFVVLALLARSVMVLREVFPAEGRGMIRMWIILAELSLWAGLGYGLMLLMNRLGSPVLGMNPMHDIAIHASLLLMGWIGGWIVAMASILVPMFLVAPEPKSQMLAVAALFWFTGVAMGWPAVWLIGALVFALAMGLSLLRRVRKNVGADLQMALLGIFGLVAVAGLLLSPASGVLAVMASLAIFALPVLHGIGLRIIPFLFWAYAFADNVQNAPLPEQVSAPSLSRLSAYGAMVAGLLLLVGYGFNLIWAWRLGVLLGNVSSISYLGAIAVTALRTWQAHNRLLSLPGTEAS
jgi:hypothetical protein